MKNKNENYILIVEDSRTQARQLADILTPLGYQISIAGNGREALESLKERKPVIVVADILMPEMDGYQLCRAIKTDAKFKGIPVVLLTQLSDPKEIIRGMESGADDFIVKPYNEELLLARILALLALKSRKEAHDKDVSILVVEDSPTQAEQLQYLLEEQGYTVMVAANGREGLDMAREKRPTLIISDILMPVMDGYELAHAIKHDDELRNIPIILVTSLMDRKDIVRRAAVVADGYFTKPYDDSYLLSKVEALLSASGSGNEEGDVEGLEVSFGGERYTITSGRRQILTFLLSTYENSVQQNRDLILMQRELQQINEQLEDKVIERTEQLQNNKKRLETIIDSSEDIIFLKDRYFRYQIANKAHEKLFNARIQDIIGKTDFDFMSKAAAEICRSSDEETIKTPYPVDMEEYVMGRYYHSVKQRITDDTEGKITGIVGIVRDITANKKMEEERIRSGKLESLGVLAGGIAHDFNNLLTGIIGNASLARMLCNPEEKVYKRLVELESASMRAKDLTQQLLTFAKGGAPIKKITSIGNLIRESVTFAMRGSNISCEFSLPEDLYTVEVDEGQISQVIHNLIINAEQAMSGGGIIKASAESISVSPSSGLPTSDGEYVKIAIKDTGVGIPRENLIKIFDPYFTTKEEGSGLGLATVYSIIKNHGGYITAESEVGAGTTFYIYLPASQKVVVPKKVAEEGPLHGKGNILVMDDEDVVRAVAEAILTELGYDVEFAKDGNRAVELYKKAKDSGTPFDAVILDLTIPGGMGGKEVIKKLVEIDPDVKAIVSSGYSSDPIMSDFTKYGFKAVMAKPYRVAELSRIVHQVVTGG